MSGFIALHREAFDHPLLKDGERFRAWFWLVSQACWKPTRVRIKGATIELQRGEFTFSQRFLAEKWGWSKSRVDRFMADLREEGMIETRSKIGAVSGATAGHNAGQGQSIITICNYAKYQDVDEHQRGNDDRNSGAVSGATAGQQRGKEEQRNKGTIKEEPNGSSPPISPKRKSNAQSVALRPPDVSDQVWSDFLAHRKRKKADVTPTVLDRINGEAIKAGWSMNDALAECVARNWQGFKADWVQPRTYGGTNGANGHDKRDGAMRALDRDLGLEQPAGQAGRSDLRGGGENRLLPFARSSP